MTVQAWIIMTPSEHTAAGLLNDEDAAVVGRQIDNPLANNLGRGTLVGNFVVGARLLNDPEFARWVPTLGLLPIAVMDSATLFIPPPVDNLRAQL